MNEKYDDAAEHDRTDARLELMRRFVNLDDARLQAEATKAESTARLQQLRDEMSQVRTQLRSALDADDETLPQVAPSDSWGLR